MITLKVNGKDYKLVFGYGALLKTDILDRIQNSNKEGLKGAISLLPELLLVGLQKRHKDEFGWETESEKEVALDKVYDLLDEYESESTEDNPQDGFMLLQQMNDELGKNGFLSRIMKIAEAESQNATKIPQDHKKKS
jgi:hypothetical protein